MKAFLQDILRQAGAMAMEYRSKLGNLRVDRKSAKDLVTDADRALEDLLIQRIGRQFPEHAIWGEETGQQKGRDYRWVIDPIDGTASFVHGQPCFCISIAIEKNGQAVEAGIYAPVLDELYYAKRGAGATCNDQPITVSACNNLSDSMLATGFACMRSDLQHDNMPYLNVVLPQIRDIRRMGSAALDLCFVAAGRFDGFWELNLNQYDIAAGALIVEEAGGTVTDFDNTRDGLPKEILATNTRLHPSLQAVLHDVKQRQRQCSQVHNK